MSGGADAADRDDERQDYRRGPAWHAQQANARKEWQRIRDLSLTVYCRDCRVAGGDVCVIRDSAGTILGELTRFPAHPTRISDSQKANQR